MNLSQANEIRLDIWHQLLSTKPKCLGGGDYIWEGGDLERLSLVDDEEPNPRKFFSCQCCVQE